MSLSILSMYSQVTIRRRCWESFSSPGSRVVSFLVQFGHDSSK